MLSSSPSTSHVQTPIDTEGCMIPSSPQFALSAPQRGHCLKSAHPSTVSSDNSSATECIPPCLPGINHAQNPLYYMEVTASTPRLQEGIEGHEGFRKSLTSHGSDSRFLTSGPSTPLNTTSDDSSSWSASTSTTNLTRQISSNLSPTGQ